MISVKNLTKKYGDFLAVDDLSFEIEEGHIYGFLGPNGAGKSTTLNIMTGCLAATDGEVLIDGHDIFEDAKEAKKLIGYLPEIPPLYVEQTPREYLTFVAGAKKIGKDKIAGEIEKVIAETHIENVADKLIRNLSKGYRQRVGIAQALLGNPEVIILDEPTVGLDPMQIIEIRDLIKELGEKHTVIFSSHILSEVQSICEKVLIIYKGKLVAFDSPENLGTSLSSGTVIRLVVDADELTARNIISTVSDVTVTSAEREKDMTRLELNATGEDDIFTCKKLFYAFADRRKAIVSMNTVKASLEDIFIELTSGADETNMVADEDTDEDSDEDLIPDDSDNEDDTPVSDNASGNPAMKEV